MFRYLIPGVSAYVGCTSHENFKFALSPEGDLDVLDGPSLISRIPLPPHLQGGALIHRDGLYGVVTTQGIASLEEHEGVMSVSETQALSYGLDMTALLNPCDDPSLQIGGSIIPLGLGPPGYLPRAPPLERVSENPAWIKPPLQGVRHVVRYVVGERVEYTRLVLEGDRQVHVTVRHGSLVYIQAFGTHVYEAELFDRTEKFKDTPIRVTVAISMSQTEVYLDEGTQFVVLPSIWDRGSFGTLKSHVVGFPKPKSYEVSSGFEIAVPPSTTEVPLSEKEHESVSWGGSALWFLGVAATIGLSTVAV